MSNTRQIVSTPNAPAAIGTYSQAVKVGQTVWLSGQIPLDPATMTPTPGKGPATPATAQLGASPCAGAAGQTH